MTKIETLISRKKSKWGLGQSPVIKYMKTLLSETLEIKNA